MMMQPRNKAKMLERLEKQKFLLIKRKKWYSMTESYEERKCASGFACTLHSRCKDKMDNEKKIAF
jgi:hypothetical protein